MDTFEQCMEMQKKLDRQFEEINSLISDINDLLKKGY